MISAEQAIILLRGLGDAVAGLPHGRATLYLGHDCRPAVELLASLGTTPVATLVQREGQPAHVVVSVEFFASPLWIHASYRREPTDAEVEMLQQGRGIDAEPMRIVLLGGGQ